MSQCDSGERVDVPKVELSEQRVNDIQGCTEGQTSCMNSPSAIIPVVILRTRCVQTAVVSFPIEAQLIGSACDSILLALIDI